MKTKRFLAALSLLMLAASGPAMAEKNIWVDENGKVHSEVKDTSAEKESPKVELYVTSWCPYCKQAIQYFRSRGIPYTVYDIEKDKSAAQRKNSLDSRGGVPFAVINGKKIQGYSPDAYDRALK